MFKWSHELACFYAGLSFYTRIPMPKWVIYKPENLNKSRKYLALIGVFVGLVAVATYLLSSLILPVSLAILLSMVATVYLTGAFHEDGYADTCDGFGGGWEKAQVLDIMKDSRVGSYGVVGLLLLLLLKFVVLWEVAQVNVVTMLLSLLLAHAISRFMASAVMQHYDYVSHAATSKSQQVVSLRLSNVDMLVSIVPIVFLLLVSLEWRFVVALLGSALITFFLGQYFKRRIGGYTGDCLGAVQQVSEVVFYLCVMAVL
ncbi:adenosylcobinamide-GDP ribazoletransferase [Leucothrix sargassi]|nr:adenosylcobinamide-GDP ribazoletransferase [Leucothrix sargassi]